MKIAEEEGNFMSEKKTFPLKNQKEVFWQFGIKIILRLTKTNTFLWIVSVLMYGTL